MNDGASLAAAVEQTVPLLSRYLAGFDDSNHTRDAPNLPNHIAWTLGHLAITMHRFAEKLDGGPLPPDDFGGDAHSQFRPEDVAFGSTPSADPSRYPTYERCVIVFRAAVDRLATALRAADATVLSQSVPWGKNVTTMGDLAVRMVFHNGTHAGQIADLRRALKMPRVL